MPKRSVKRMKTDRAKVAPPEVGSVKEGKSSIAGNGEETGKKMRSNLLVRGVVTASAVVVRPATRHSDVVLRVMLLSGVVSAVCAMFGI